MGFVPIALILLGTALKDLIEDWNQSLADKHVNGRKAFVWNTYAPILIIFFLKNYNTFLSIFGIFYGKRFPPQKIGVMKFEIETKRNEMYFCLVIQNPSEKFDGKKFALAISFAFNNTKRFPPTCCSYAALTPNVWFLLRLLIWTVKRISNRNKCLKPTISSIQRYTVYTHM